MGNQTTLSASSIEPAIWSGGPKHEEAKALWTALVRRLDDWQPGWENYVSAQKKPSAATKLTIAHWSEKAVFRAFAIAAISGNSRWDRIAAVEEDLHVPFQEFYPHRFADLTDDQIRASIVPWFRERRAGSARLTSVLLRLKDSARILGSNNLRSAARFVEQALAESGGSPEQAAVLIGTPSSYKLPGFGIALAAEALRLLGLDVCKPDRHVLRAMASWSIVSFQKWPPGEFSAPSARPVESLATMLAVRQLAFGSGVSVSFATSAIWLAGAVSGARLTNDELKRLSLSRPFGKPHVAFEPAEDGC